MARENIARLAGFTLIELLIVVLIIAILAAIAVPNFLEFQTRAKVARVRADLRTIAMALEAYCVDWGDYPRNWSAGDMVLTPDLSTPIAYLGTSNIFDPFGKHLDSPNSHVYGYHRFMTLGQALAFPADSPFRPDITSVDHPDSNPGAFRRHGQWLLHSIGPSRKWWDESVDWEPHDTLYDPTNGTRSFGNIARSQLHPEGKVPDNVPR